MKKEKFSKNKTESVNAEKGLSKIKKGLLISIVLIGLLSIIQLIVGFKINSVVLLANAAHSFSGAAGIGIALIATMFATRPVSKDKTFGFLKAEMFAAWINGALLFVMAYVILEKGITDLLNPKSVELLPMVILSVIGLVISGIPAILLFKEQKTNVNVRGAFWHIAETVLGSFAVLLAALIIYFTGWTEADPIFGMLLAPVLIVASWKILKESTRELLDSTPRKINLTEIEKSIKKIKGIKKVYHVHIWDLSPGKISFLAHIKIEKNINHDNILQKINSMLNKKYNIYFSTIQIEKEGSKYGEPMELDVG